jgi:hypothetical protein
MSRLGKDIQKLIPINDQLLSDARAGQYTGKSVRIVVDIKSFKHYKIFSLKNPFRIVLDVWGQETEISRSPKTSTLTGSQALRTGKLPPGAIARQLALGVQPDRDRSGPRWQGLRCAGLSERGSRKTRGPRRLPNDWPGKGGKRSGLRCRTDPDHRPLPDRWRNEPPLPTPRMPTCSFPSTPMRYPQRQAGLRHRNVFPQPGHRRRCHPGGRPGKCHFGQKHQRSGVDFKRPDAKRQDKRIQPPGGHGSVGRCAGI